MSGGGRSRFNRAGDLPLILFTSLALMGAGAMAALFAAGLAVEAATRPPESAVVIALALIGGGLVISLAHLGRKRRMPLALRGLTRSPLSLEVVLAAATTGLLAARLLLGPDASRILEPLASFTSLLLLIAIGLVYRLGGQLTWRGAALPAPLVSGLLWGVLLHATLGTVAVEGISSVVYLLVAFDIVLTERRWNTIERKSGIGEARDGRALTRRRSLLMLRVATVDLIGAGCFLLALPFVSLVGVTAGVFIDRYAFYALGIQHTTGAEIARIETIIRGGSG
jgi:DMSO reductase anchor subunit